MSSLSGPKISFAVVISKFPATSIRASAACFGVSNCFCCGCAAEVDSCFGSGAAWVARTNKKQLTIAQVITKNFDEVIIFAFDFICFSSSSVYLRPPPPPRPPPAPPPGLLPAPAPPPGRFPAPVPPPGLLPAPAPPPGRLPAPAPPPGLLPAPAPPAPGRAPAPPAAPCPRVVPPYLFAVCLFP